MTQVVFIMTEMTVANSVSKRHATLSVEGEDGSISLGSSIYRRFQNPQERLVSHDEKV
jgi:hypothetical protein